PCSVIARCTTRWLAVLLETGRPKAPNARTRERENARTRRTRTLLLEFLNARVARIGHVDSALAVDRDAAGGIERACLGTGPRRVGADNHAPGGERPPVSRQLLDATVTGVAHVHVATRVHRNAGGQLELARIGSFPAPLRQRLPRGREHLYALVGRIGDDHLPLRIHGHV